MFTRQHQTTGLQTPYEGPFKIDQRLSKSTVRIEVGIYADGSKRYEVRHLNDLKLAHPDSLAAPVQRPKLGRRSNPTEALNQTEQPIESGQTNRLIADPKPTKTLPVADVNKDRVGIQKTLNHATSTPSVDIPAPDPGEPGKIQMTKRTVRSTRNPNPIYVDSLTLGPPPSLGFPANSDRMWSASPAELAVIQRSIG